MRLVLSMCLVETERTLNEVWSSAKNAFKSDLDTCLISLSPLSNFVGDLKPVVMLPLKNMYSFDHLD